MGASKHATSSSVADLLRVDGDVRLSDIDARATPGFGGGKSNGKKALSKLGAQVSDLQERLFAEGAGGGSRSILLVLQGMDTSGKGGTVRHSIGHLDPQGVHLVAFKAPTPAERRHHFLWRVRRRLPDVGMVGIFDRSHYEDVLAARVRGRISSETVEERYEAINAFESEVLGRGTTLVKCMLHISPGEQRARLCRRLDREDKRWKFNPGDIDDRALWDDFQRAYEETITRCSDAAPWYVVPADRKWYRNWAVTRLLHEHLEAMDPQWPSPDYDVEEQRERLRTTA